MKGISHFMAGVAAASCFPGAVSAAADGNPPYFVLGAIFGILPDTLDFKFIRFFVRHDILVVPDPLAPDPAMIARGVAHAANLAASSGKPVRIKLSSVRLSADRWQEYRVRFNTAEKRVEAVIGPVVNTGACPVDKQPSEDGIAAEAMLTCDVEIEYEATVTVNIFDGPLLQFTPRGEGRVSMEFIPWHRRATHSLVTALVAGLVVGALLQPLAGLVAFSAMAMHTFLDQLGFMGSSLFHPFTRRRTPGWGFTRSMDAMPNLAAVWTSAVVIFWNLNRAMPHPPVDATLGQMLLVGVLAPLAVLVLCDKLIARLASGACSGCNSVP